jgi:hypothetical protein
VGAIIPGQPHAIGEHTPRLWRAQFGPRPVTWPMGRLRGSPVGARREMATWPPGHPIHLMTATARRTLMPQMPIYVHVLNASLSLGGMKIWTSAAMHMAIPSPARTSSGTGNRPKLASAAPCGQLDHSTASAKVAIKIARKAWPAILKLGTHRLQDRVRRGLFGWSKGHLVGLTAALACKRTQR